MESLPDYDFSLQFSGDVLCTAQTRVINASLLTNLALERPISRVLAGKVPVMVQLAAALADSPEPPYDYVWHTDQQRHPGKHHSPTLTVIKTPLAATATGAPHKLATINLKVIDMLGQLGRVEVEAMYCPAKTLDQKKYQHGREKSVSPLGVGVLAGASQLYKKWWVRTKDTPTVVRATGIAVAVAIVVFFAFQSFSVLNTPTRDVHQEQSPPPPAQPPPRPVQPPAPLPTSEQPPPPLPTPRRAQQPLAQPTSEQPPPRRVQHSPAQRPPQREHQTPSEQPSSGSDYPSPEQPPSVSDRQPPEQSSLPR